MVRCREHSWRRLTHHLQVPVIAVFTKYDQFQRNVKMHVEDYGNPDDDVSDAVERLFEEHYLRHLGDGARFVRLESPLSVKCQMSRVSTDPLVKEMQKPETRCHALLEETVEVLNEDVVAMMLLAVQRTNLELSIKMAAKR